MAFQPFGHPFGISSSLSASELKKSIRSRNKGWFDMNDGARGWVVGPVVCLWFSAFDRQGPMLLGWISRNTWGTQITGRAGSDLNGLLVLAVLTPFMIFAVFMMVSTGGSRSLDAAVLASGLYVFICGIVLWTKHLFRREAEPLVRFLRDVATKSSPPRQAGPSAGAKISELVLSVNGEDQGPVTSDIHIRRSTGGVSRLCLRNAHASLGRVGSYAMIKIRNGARLPLFPHAES